MAVQNTERGVTASQSAIYHRIWDKDYPIASGGEGVYILHPDGSKTLDGSSGAAVSCLGHGHAAIIEAIVEQARKFSYAHTTFFTSDPAEKLAHILTSESDGAFTRTMFVSSGSEAVESALKIARQYHVANGDSQRTNFICRQYAYHGNTLGALAAGYNPPRRKPFEAILSQAFHHVSPCFYSRDGLSGEDEDTYVLRLLVEYEEMFQRIGPSTVAAVMVEPVVGATLGCVPAARGYLAGLRNICDRHGALLIFDEVMCGMGRIGTMHAWQSLGNVAPDLQTIGKGLGAGYQPISAVLVNSKVAKRMQSTGTTNPFISGHTYQGHSIGCAAAVAVQRTIREDKLLENVQQMGTLLKQKLRERTPLLKDIRGLGLFVAVEFATKPNKGISTEVSRLCLSKGAAVYLSSAVVDAIIFCPPYIINEEEVELLVKIFIESVEEALA